MNDNETTSGERLYWGSKSFIPRHAAKEHLDRYHFALERIKPEWVVLDAACGSGYGSEILAGKAKRVQGLDYSAHAIEYAKGHHKKDNNDFAVADFNEPIPLPAQAFDAVVSFETLEHVKNQNTMLSELHRVLKPGGVLILSTPDRAIYGDQSHIHSHFHVAELTKKELLDVLEKFFDVESVYGQTKFVNLPLWKKAVKRVAKLDKFGVRRRIIKSFGLTDKVHGSFATETVTDIEQVPADTLGEHHLVIVVGKNKK